MNTVTRVTRFSPASLVSPAGGRLPTATTPHGRAACDRRASCGEEGQQPCFYFDKAVTVSSDAIRILQAGEISREDLFEVNVFHPGDSPLVEEGELGEILSIIEEKTRAGRIRQP